MNFVLRSSRSAASLMPDVRRIVQHIDSEQPVHEVATMREIIQRSMTLERAGSFLTSFFAGAALLLATLGVFGAVSYSVRQRTVEIGTRVALGASSRGVLSLIVGSGLKMAAFGVIAGGIAAFAAASSLGRVFKIGELGPAPFLYSTAIVTVVAFVASFVPAWRAALLSPMVAIRNQPESLWRAARLKVRRALRTLSAASEPAVVPLGALVTEFADAVRRAASFPEAVQAALGTLQERAGAQSITLLEKASNEYRSAECSVPANGILLRRLRHYPHPLTMTPGEIEAWLRWAREYRPEHTAEIQAVANTGARIGVALRTKNEIVGVLLLGPPVGRESYTTAEKQVIGSSAEIFALMIENARLNERALEQEKVRRDLALAAEVQRRLLPPQPPQNGAATLSAFSLPARTVGGDYYDFLDLDDGQVGLAVADISGKGIAAALLMSVVQASLQVLSTENRLSLPQLTEKMNGFLYRSTGTSKYATFFYAELDDRARRLRYVNAGHNPPYHVRRTESGVAITELKVGGTVLGLFPEMTYDEAEIALEPGDLVVAFTDGVPEALNVEGEEFGEERLKSVLRSVVGAAASEVSAQLAGTMREWIGEAEQYDDLTCLVVAVN
jgi:serine phosphatase RsbU (regulator of sigma subunit)